MKRIHYILTILLFSAFAAVAQEDDVTPQQVDPKAREKMEAARIALITDRLGLTPQQAERFWPIYREFTDRRMEMRNEFRQMQRNIDPQHPDPKKQEELIKVGLQLKQQELDMEKDYSGRLMQVISAQQLLSLRKAEQDFRQMILNRLQERRQLQQRKENFRDQNQRLRENRK